MLRGYAVLLFDQFVNLGAKGLVLNRAILPQYIGYHDYHVLQFHTIDLLLYDSHGIHIVDDVAAIGTAFKPFFLLALVPGA